MGKIITVASHKGGVGKTTTTLNLGYSLTRLGQKVLIVDSDPQGAMAVASNLKKRTSGGLINILRDNSERNKVVIPTRDKTMAILGIGVNDPEDIFFLEKEARKGNVGKIIRSIGADYDYTLIDAPAGIGTLLTALLSISDSVLMPINSKAIAVKTIPIFLKLTQKIREKLNPNLRLEGVLVTMVDEREENAVMLQQLKGSFPPPILFDTIIPYDSNFESASIRALPVGLLPGGDETARPYMDLAIELKSRELSDKQRGIRDEDVTGLF